MPPIWQQVGRVCFHLAENKGDPRFPFAFLATYAPRLSRAGRVTYQPLGRALQEYAGARNKKALINLLSPVQRGGGKDRFRQSSCGFGGGVPSPGLESGRGLSPAQERAPPGGGAASWSDSLTGGASAPAPVWRSPSATGKQNRFNARRDAGFPGRTRLGRREADQEGMGPDHGVPGRPGLREGPLDRSGPGETVGGPGALEENRGPCSDRRDLVHRGHATPCRRAGGPERRRRLPG